MMQGTIMVLASLDTCEHSAVHLSSTYGLACCLTVSEVDMVIYAGLVRSFQLSIVH